MGEVGIYPTEYLSIQQLCERHGLKEWRIYQITRASCVPVQHLNGKPIIPYRIDAAAFAELLTASRAERVPRARAKPALASRSLKTEETQKSDGHRKELLWRE